MKHLCAPLVRAAAAVGGAEAEAAGAALRVGWIQVERPNSALITPSPLDVLLGRKMDAHVVKAFRRRGGRGGRRGEEWGRVPYLTETLSCEGVAHFILGSRLITVTLPAVGVTIETGGTAVALASGDVVSTSGKHNQAMLLPIDYTKKAKSTTSVLATVSHT